MDPSNALEIKNITKSFKIEVEDKERKSILISKKPTKTVDYVAVNDVSFNVRKGEVLGILGRNGSGKSTLLSMIAKIMEPDSGSIERSGKIASILELGMGFHPDMSGRDNIYLKGELYGFSKKEIDSKIERIIDYSGIGEFIDNPVRTYSSGMTGRLAFAIMVNVDSDIMIVDEVLSVGDTAFSTKAQQHFKQLSKSGKTIVIVLHNINMLETMCTRVIWLEEGKIKKDGLAKTVCSEYQNELSESPDILNDLASGGVAEAQYKLALMYRDGNGVENNEKMYENWIKQAAIQGHVKAQVAYADLLMTAGESSEALGYYQSAANKGDEEARIKLSSLSSGKNGEVQLLLQLYGQLISDDDPVNLYRYADLLLKTAWYSEDKELSFSFFLKSAERGYLNALHQVGVMYRDAIGTNKNVAKMEYYLKIAADKGYLPSILLLADIYMQGKLLPKNEQKTFEYIKKASELGHVPSMYRLAIIYRDGVGVDKDVEKSNYWFDVFTSAGLFQYKNWLLPYLRTGRVGSEDIYFQILDSTKLNGNPALITEAMNVLLLKNSNSGLHDKLIEIADTGNVDAMHRVGDRYSLGLSCSKNSEEAFKWYYRAAQNGDSWCRNKVAEMYKKGEGTEPSVDLSIKYYTLSAYQGNIDSIYNLISIYHEQDNKIKMDEMINILERLAFSGNIHAARRLGDLYYYGQLVRINKYEALKWYDIAASLGDLWSKRKSSEMYREGDGVPVDLVKSINWFK